MTKEKKFRKDYAYVLITISYEDLESAQLLFKSNPKRKENIFFLCQQAAEKGLKAGLCFLSHPLPLIHDLRFIIDRYPQAYQVPESEKIIELTEFATIRRYEGSVVEYSEDEIQAALDSTQIILDWVTHLISNQNK
jgi:HEPN domain-containing protein